MRYINEFNDYTLVLLKMETMKTKKMKNDVQFSQTGTSMNR
jgi:hypothetical protein